MSKKDYLKVILLIVVPINTWLGMIYYLQQQKKKAEVFYPSSATIRMNTIVRVSYITEKWGIKEGKRLIYPFPIGNSPTVYFGVPPKVGQGQPVLFINIAWNTSHEVWEPVIKEALNTSPSLQIVLLFDSGPRIFSDLFEENIKRLKKMLSYFRSPRIFVMAGGWVRTVFGGSSGILAFLCDGDGIVRAVEFYPELKFSPSWDEEVKDWRPKLHQAVKKVLDKFFPEKGTGAK